MSMDALFPSTAATNIYQTLTLANKRQCTPSTLGQESLLDVFEGDKVVCYI